MIGIVERDEDGRFLSKYSSEEEKRAAINAASRRYRAKDRAGYNENMRNRVSHRDPEKRRISHNRACAIQRQIRRDIIARGKSRPCYDCHQRYPKCVMDFDHIERNKKFDISAGTNKSIPALIAEIDKCEVVCANCHRIREWKRYEDRRSKS